MDPAQFLQGRTRETELRRDARGRWFSGEDPINHPNLTRSFDSWIDRAEDGRFCLSNSINWAYVAIEGPAYFVKDVEPAPEGVGLVLSGDLRERLDPASLRQGPEGALWCAVREGRCPARFDNHAVSKMSDSIREDEDGVYLLISGEKVRPPETDDPLSLGLEKR
ncbi:MAG: hypothetical protein JRD92_05260 [Deltaproteobacteria bacterium]|nr:hypothetical protein [Deltaproteobacteria bacterium]MBW1904947.1 hypothetical protein [Deltaproteobacteria bacterium]MBW2160368.1 hypothetical protein [Deltaproteobacteria bacterium]MBW2374382.1 hypothetical protein [Deltaproteobacteria bacterium]MBW2586341.1 hypothetical protein [Deltaproteobacteria bacterium]